MFTIRKLETRMKSNDIQKVPNPPRPYVYTPSNATLDVGRFRNLKTPMKSRKVSAEQNTADSGLRTA